MMTFRNEPSFDLRNIKKGTLGIKLRPTLTVLE